MNERTADGVSIALTLHFLKTDERENAEHNEQKDKILRSSRNFENRVTKIYYWLARLCMAEFSVSIRSTSWN